MDFTKGNKMKTGLMALLLLSSVTVAARYGASAMPLHAVAGERNLIAGRNATEDYHYGVDNICERNKLRYEPKWIWNARLNKWVQNVSNDFDQQR